MKTLKRTLITAGLVAALGLIPAEIANAYWLPGYQAWHNAYLYDPAYRWGPPRQRQYLRDLYRYGAEYAHWRQQRRTGWWW